MYLTTFKKRFKKEYGFYLFIFMVLSLTYAQLILNNPTINYDDESLIGPIKALNSLSQFQEFKQKGYFLDIQPVRDLCYFITYKLSNIFSIINFHSVSMFLWFFVCVFVFKIFIIFTENLTLSMLLTFLLAVSPVSSSSVAWISAQKHLLSCFFIVMLTYLSICFNRDTVTTKKSFIFFVLYTLAIYSHPINLLWPIWFIAYCLYRKFEIKKILLFISPALVSGIVCFILNQRYYEGNFLKLNFDISKFDPELSSDLGAKLLAIGRYTYLSLFSFDALPSPHYIGSIENVVGLVLLVLLIYCAYYFYKKKQGFLPFIMLLYFLLPLVPVTYKITRVFCSDTYALNASLGIYFFMGLIFKKINSKILIYLLTGYAVFIAGYNYQYVKIFNDSFDLWKYSYNKEATPDSAVGVASLLVEKKQHDQAEQFIQRVRRWQPGNINIYGIAVRNIFFNVSQTDQLKIHRLSRFYPQRPITHFYLSILYSNRGDVKNLKSEMTMIFKNVPFFLSDLGESRNKVVGTYLGICEKYKIEFCQSNLEYFKGNFKNDIWNYEVINKSKQEVLSSKIINYKM